MKVVILIIYFRLIYAEKAMVAVDSSFQSHGSSSSSRRKKVSALEPNFFGSMCIGVYSSDVSISAREAAQDYSCDRCHFVVIGFPLL